ncbi:GNAT family N-acetyltransferase [Polynucleobacter sp. AP-Titi-500A-B4]|uniref:GNAT family N-acetyltransferase n=1 Tax=Polynucleobacter sp. AP-Titi-500A-B4 TaxID=2576923 RepID=UPI001BFCEAB9|nr:GNAT family N-acetyltransferase [Polynucleobacter sp. AP-Titi-500A-B4]QWE13343.1 N-acetyltransferase [Polynucleobacter sp. AP-Titi-500A-B4]
MSGVNKLHIEILDRLSDVSAAEWNALHGPDAGPFLKHEFLSALEETGCVGGTTGWQVAHLVLKRDEQLVGAMPLYLKQHSYGEFVFDWSWAQAYEQQGLNYYPKVLCAIPFTPVQGSRILCKSESDQNALIGGLKSLLSENGLSSAHILFPMATEAEQLKAQGFLLRDSVQFHWHNQDFQSFEQFLSALTMKRRKNIRREREQVAREAISFRHVPGKESTDQDWEFFFDCYQNTYLEHHSSPYLSEAFFKLWVKRSPENLHLIIAQRNGVSIASSLLVVDKQSSKAYGRYWGALEHIPCLHFETAYYQAIEYCITQGIQTFEGGAQGEHKMARGFLPTTIQSAHFIQDPRFSKAVAHFLEREHQGIGAYVDELAEHSPLKSTKVLP